MLTLMFVVLMIAIMVALFKLFLWVTKIWLKVSIGFVEFALVMAVIMILI